MIIETEEMEVRHPDGKILLNYGKVLDCYPKENPHRPGIEPWKELFFKEAFFLYEHKEQILADSRMFLTPLPFENNLAYTGSSGLRNATLGVYLEWWSECERAVIKKDGGEVQALTYFIAGSPLSGSNHCSAVEAFILEETISKLCEV